MVKNRPADAGDVGLISGPCTAKRFPGSSVGKKSACSTGDPGFNPWVGKILWRRKWQPTPVFLPGESHGQRSLEGYSPWVCKSRT